MDPESVKSSQGRGRSPRQRHRWPRRALSARSACRAGSQAPPPAKKKIGRLRGVEEGAMPNLSATMASHLYIHSSTRRGFPPEVSRGVQMRHLLACLLACRDTDHVCELPRLELLTDALDREERSRARAEPNHHARTNMIVHRLVPADLQDKNPEYLETAPSSDDVQGWIEQEGQHTRRLSWPRRTFF